MIFISVRKPRTLNSSHASLVKQFNTANHIYRHRLRVLPYHTGADPPYGLHYLSPYKIHRSIFARVGHHVFKTYFHRLLPLTFPHRTDYVNLLILISVLHLGADSQLIVLVWCFLFPGRPIHPPCLFFHASNPCCLFSHLSPSNPPFLPGLTPALAIFLHLFSM
jgi:hypothetical protein